MGETTTVRWVRSTALLAFSTRQLRDSSKDLSLSNFLHSLRGTNGNTWERVPVCGNMEERVGNSLPGRMGALTGNIGERAKCWGMVGNSIWERESVGLRSFTFKLPFIARRERKGTRENAFGLWERMGAHGELAPSGNKSHSGERRGMRYLCGDLGEPGKERGSVGPRSVREALRARERGRERNRWRG